MIVRMRLVAGTRCSRPRTLLAAVVVAGLAMGSPPPAAGRPGDLDRTFGTGGTLTTDFTGGSDRAHGVALQGDGKIVAAGHSVGSLLTERDFALARYNADGTLDSTFGSGGKVTTDFTANRDVAIGVAVQPDGKIVAGGFTFNGDTLDFALARYMPHGRLDTTFGSGGKVTTDFASGLFKDDERANDIALLGDGKILAAGFTEVPRPPRPHARDFLLARYNADGTLDPTFGSGGKVTTDFGNLDRSSDIALQPDGKIVAGGFTETPQSQADFALARYNADGTPDPSFGSGGKVTTDFGASLEVADGVAIQSDGKILAAGGSGGDFTLARYNSDGTLDSSFGSGGKVLTDVKSGSEDQAFDLLIEGDSNPGIVVAGVSGGDFALVRYRRRGALDDAFGSGGKVVTDFGSDSDTAFAIAPQRDRKAKIVATGGKDALGPAGDFALARYIGGGAWAAIVRSCLARRSRVGPRNIGRARLGYTRRRLLRLPVKPVRRTRRSYRYCVKGSRGRVTAVFSSRSGRGRVRLVTTTARGHGNRRVRVGSRAASLRRAYPSRSRIRRGLYRASPRSPRLFGLRAGRVCFVAVADRRLLGKPRTLRRYLRLAGL